MLVSDSRLLEVVLFETLRKNRGTLDFGLLLPELVTIANEVDSQLAQAINSYMGVVLKPVAA